VSKPKKHIIEQVSERHSHTLGREPDTCANEQNASALPNADMHDDAVVALFALSRLET